MGGNWEYKAHFNLYSPVELVFAASIQGQDRKTVKKSAAEATGGLRAAYIKLEKQISSSA